MAKKKKESFFWTSYSDLMTSLFFVMLVLFILTVALMHNRHKATAQQLEKVKELYESIKQIDTTYFKYDSTYKRHTLKNIQVKFARGSSDINDLSKSDIKKLCEAGRAIQTFMTNAKDSITNAEYMLIIEGQSSKDGYVRNNELSYERALALVEMWRRNDIKFDTLPCELIITGSGQSSRFREQPDNRHNAANQRFVIHIIPKPGNF